MTSKIGQHSLIRVRDLDRWLRNLPPQLQRGRLDLSPKPHRIFVDSEQAGRLLRKQLSVPPSATVEIPAWAVPAGIAHPAPFLIRLRSLSCYGPLLEKAFRLAWEGHIGQVRRSKHPYIEHPLAVAEMAAEYGLGEKECAVLLGHDLIEDAIIGGKRVTREFLARELGNEVADMVEGITELGKEPEYVGDKPPVLERYKKWLEYGSRDLSIIILKLFDRLHNMRTLEYMDQVAQTKKARETLNVYAKIADRLGMWGLKRELEDLSFKYLEPELYRETNEKIREIREKSKAVLGSKEDGESIIGRMDRGLMGAGIRIDFELEQRGVYELYERMQLREIPLEELTPTDIWRLNIVVPEEQDCKNIEGRIQKLYSPNQGEIRNFIAEPLSNGHQFLQSYLKVPIFGELLVQIRDRSMYDNYIRGVLATGKGEKEKQLLWLNAMLSILKEEGTSERVAYKTLAAYSAPIVAKSPDEKEIELPFGATVLDFAREIHEDVFRHATAAIVNGRHVELSHVLNHGDRVEIVTSERSRPKIEWVELVHTPKARAALRKHLKRRQNKTKRKDALLALDSALNSEEQSFYLRATGLIETMLFRQYISQKGRKNKAEEFLQEIGAGKRKASDVVSDLNKLYLSQLDKHKDRRAKLAPYYLSIGAKNWRGLLANILDPLKEMGYHVFDSFPVNPEGEGEITLVLGVVIFGGRHHGGIVGQIQRMQVRTIAEEQGKQEEGDKVKVQVLNRGQFQRLSAIREEWAKGFSF